MKRKTLLAALISSLLITSCAETPPPAQSPSEELTTAENVTEAETVSQNTDAEENAPEESDDVKHITYVTEISDDGEYEFSTFGSDGVKNVSSPELTESFKEIFNEIKGSGQIYPIEDSLSADYTVYVRNKVDENTEEYIEIKKYSGRYENFISLNGSVYYPLYPPNEKLDEFAKKLGAGESIPDRMYSVVYECPEPVTNDDYINAARQCVYKWLDTLKTVDDPEYKISSYTPNGKEAVFGTFIAAGMISGAKEFAVNVLFDVEGTGKDSVFAPPSNSGYNTFYHYYNGPCAVVRCRWEDGACRIVQHDGAYMGNVSDGLYGINVSEEGYATFFDFLRDKDAVEKYKSADMENTEDIVLSHNPFMISDGKIFFADIDLPYDRKLTVLENGKVSGKFGDSFYSAEGWGVYSSPVRYNNDKREPYTLTFSREFDLIFDDYNHDGNPDYTVKFDEDENGSYYSIECIANDGSPRADRNEVYIAGRFEDSIRLECTPKGYITWSADENGKPVPSEEIDKYRMYSERYYFPAAFRAYLESETSVNCFFWNNTDSPVSAGGQYSIERKSGDEWINAGSGSVPQKTCEPYREAELEFDISSLSERISGEYRIALSVNGEKVYGGFYLNGEAQPECEVSSETEKAPSCVRSISFSVENKGESPQRLSAARLIKEGGESVNIDVTKTGLISSGGVRKITVRPEDMGLSSFEPGKYTLEVTCAGVTFSSFDVELTEVSDESRLYFFGGKADAVREDGKVTITVKNNIWSEEAANLYLYDIGCIEVLRDGKWTDSCYRLSDAPSYYDYDYDTDDEYLTVLDFGGEKEFEFADTVAEYLADEESAAYFREFYEQMMSELDDYLKEEYITKEEYDKISLMSFEGFIYYVMDIDPADIGAEDLCRVRLGDEYAYFTVENANA